MNITIPDNIDDGLQKLPEGLATVALEKIILGVSKANKPKATFRYVIIEEMENASEGKSTVGATILETYSLQPQALFNLARTYKEATKEALPQGDYSEEEFLALISQALCGSSWNVILTNEAPYNDPNGELRTNISKKTFLSFV